MGKTETTEATGAKSKSSGSNPMDKSKSTGKVAVTMEKSVDKTKSKSLEKTKKPVKPKAPTWLRYLFFANIAVSVISFLICIGSFLAYLKVF